MKRQRLCVLAIVAALFSTAGGIARSADYFVSYEVTLDAGIPDVTNIMIIQKTENGGGLNWPYTADGGQSATTTILSDPFVKSEPITANLIIGLTQGLIGYPPTQKHVVLMMSNASAALANTIAWGDLFTSTSEVELIDAIELATSGQSFEIIQPGIDFINAFIDGEGSSILGPGDIPTSTYFGLGDTFTVMAFSEGQQIGSGQSIVTPVPEPSAFVAVGFAALVLAVSRRLLPHSIAPG